jgi:hypothetical protein
LHIRQAANAPLRQSFTISCAHVGQHIVGLGILLLRLFGLLRILVVLVVLVAMLL